MGGRGGQAPPEWGPPGASGGGRLVLATLSVMVLSVAMPATMLATVPEEPRSTAWLLTLGVMLWSGLRLSMVWVAGDARLFDFFFWLYTYIFMGMAPTAQIRSGLVSTTTPGVDVALDTPAALVVWLGIIAYEVGRGWMVLRERAATRKPQRGLPAAVDERRAYLLVLAGLLGSGFFLARMGVTLAFSSRTQAAAARVAAWPDPAVAAMVYAAAIYPLLIAAGALSEVRRARRPGQRRLALTLGIAFSCLVLLLIVNPIASARYTFGTMAFGLIAYLGSLRTRARARLTMLGTIFGFLFVFPLADAFRRDVTDFSRSGFFDEYLGNPDYDSFWQIANAIDFWTSGNARPLNQLLGSLFFWVPRALWPGKPMDTGTLLAQYRGYDFGNLSAPLWSEMMVNGGWIAVGVGFLLVGAGLRAFDTRLRRAFSEGGLWAIVGAVFPVYLTILLRGSLLQATGVVFVAVACIWFVRAKRVSPHPLGQRR